MQALWWGQERDLNFNSFSTEMGKNHTLDSKLQRHKVKIHYDLFYQMKHSSCSEIISSYIIMLKNRQRHKLFEVPNILQNLCRLVKSLVNISKSRKVASAISFSNIFKVTCHFHQTLEFFCLFWEEKWIYSEVVHNSFLTMLGHCFLASS